MDNLKLICCINNISVNLFQTSIIDLYSVFSHNMSTIIMCTLRPWINGMKSFFSCPKFCAIFYTTLCTIYSLHVLVTINDGLLLDRNIIRLLSTWVFGRGYYLYIHVAADVWHDFAHSPNILSNIAQKKEDFDGKISFTIRFSQKISKTHHIRLDII